MRVQLISPFLEDKTGYPHIYRFPNTGLALLAALTPPDIEISIIDEMYDTLNFNRKVDLVGIAVTSKTVARAYQMADQFRSRGVAVVLGGIHPTILPGEAIQHADAVVIGEAEDVWGEILRDTANGRLNLFYRANQSHSLKNLPIARRELFKSRRYDFVNLVQTSRGCPYACHFCSISKIYGKGVRSRPVDEIIKEIKKLQGDRLFFTDDNIVGRPDHAEQWLTRLAPLKKKWIAQASVTVAYNDKLLRLLQKSGCQGLFIGFETTSAEGLKEANKKWKKHPRCPAEHLRILVSDRECKAHCLQSHIRLKRARHHLEQHRHQFSVYGLKAKTLSLFC